MQDEATLGCVIMDCDRLFPDSLEGANQSTVEVNAPRLG